MKSCKTWLNEIEKLHPAAIDLTLDRVKAIAEHLELTHFANVVVTVGGTNGKGSTIRCLESIYLAGGYRVAAYTSPHILSFNERLRVNGQDIDNDSLVTAFEVIDNTRRNKPLTFFEFTTLAILWLCKTSDVDVIILEVGMGGRLDAVNIVKSNLALITTVDLDHTEWLGCDRESIGKEKAGIIKENGVVICGDPKPPESVVSEAHKKKATFYCSGKDFRWRIDGHHWCWTGMEIIYGQLPFPNQLMLENASAALGAISQLQAQLPISKSAIQKGLQKAHLPGRFEMIDSKPQLVFDVAHNPQSMSALAARLKKEARRMSVVIGMLKDKDIAASILSLIPLIDRWYAGTLVVSRGASSEQMAKILAEAGVKICYTHTSISQALKQAIQDSDQEDLIVVTGSFYTVGEAKMFITGGNNGS